jgi:hypothetical protein
VLNLIRSHALLHRATRDRDKQGRVVATIEDYAVVRSLIVDLISEGAEATVPEIVRETVEKVEQLIEDSDEASVNIGQVGAELGLDYQPTYRRVKMAGRRRPDARRRGDPAPARGVGHIYVFRVFGRGRDPPPPSRDQGMNFEKDFFDDEEEL